MLSVRCPAIENRKLKASSCYKAIGSFSRGAAFSIKTCLQRSRDVDSCLMLSLPGQQRQHRVRGAQQDGCVLCLKRLSVIWVQAEIALLCRSATVYPVSREVGRGHGTVFDFMWVVLPRWNTMAEPDTAHSHTVLPHWKSHKTRVIRDSGAVDDVFWIFGFLTCYLTFALFLSIINNHALPHHLRNNNPINATFRQ